MKCLSICVLFMVTTYSSAYLYSSNESQNRKRIYDYSEVLPHERFCKYFYGFDRDEAHLVSCPRGQRFDAEKLECLKSKEVNCGKRRKNMDSSEEKVRINYKCPKWSGLHKHEYYCHLFYSCQNKRERLFKCPQGMLFDERSNKCADRGNVACNNRFDPNVSDDENRPTMKPEVFVCPSKSGKYPHERDCSAFYKCDNRKYRIQHCSKGKLYNEYKKNCEPENKVTCGRRIHPDMDPDEPEDKVVDPKPNYRCDRNFGRHDHERFCNWYYQCQDKLPSIRECRRGRRYDRHRRKCYEKHEVHTCDGKPDNEEATTISISTEPETTPTELEPLTANTTAEPSTTTTIEPTTVITTEPNTTTTTEPTTTQSTTLEPTTTTTTEPTTTPTTEPTTTPTTEPTTTPTTEPTTTPTTEPTTTPTTEEPTATAKPRVTAPDTDCDEDDVDCIIDDLGETPDWFVCPDDLGSYPHPSSKKLFIFCLNWKPFVKKCGQDLVFSEGLSTCVHP